MVVTLSALCAANQFALLSYPDTSATDTDILNLNQKKQTSLTSIPLLKQAQQITACLFDALGVFSN
jgi:hypothetical protein